MGGSCEGERESGKVLKDEEEWVGVYVREERQGSRKSLMEVGENVVRYTREGIYL